MLLVLSGLTLALPNEVENAKGGKGDGDTLIEENAPFSCPGFGVFPHPTRCEWYYTCYFGDSIKLW